MPCPVWGYPDAATLVEAAMSSFLPFSSSQPPSPTAPAPLRTAVAGPIVPTLTIELPPGRSVFFEHHILLWKTTDLDIRLRPLKGAFKRLIAGMDILVTEAFGPGAIAFSRDIPGEIRAFELAPGMELQVREHAFLAATGDLDYTWERAGGITTMMFGGAGLIIDRFVAGPGGGTVWLHGGGNVIEMTLGAGEQLDLEPGGWLYKDPSVTMETKYQGLSQGLLAAQNLAVNRLTGPGRIGIQSLYAPPAGAAAPDEPATTPQNLVATGAAGVAGALFSSLFGGSSNKET